jgi:hypothetical protein
MSYSSEKSDNIKSWLPPKSSWGPLPSPRSEHFAFARGSKMYIFGGHTKKEAPNEKNCIFSLETRTNIPIKIVFNF